MAKRDKKITIDEELIRRVAVLAKELKTTESQVLALFIAKGLISVEEEESSIWSRLVDSKSRGYKHNIDLDDLLRRLKGEDG